MNEFFASPVSGWVAIGLMAVGSFLAIYLAISLPNSPLKTQWAIYVSKLDAYVKFLLLKQTGAEIARNQAIIISILHLFSPPTGELLAVFAPCLSGAAPFARISRHTNQPLE